MEDTIQMDNIHVIYTMLMLNGITHILRLLAVTVAKSLVCLCVFNLFLKYWRRFSSVHIVLAFLYVEFNLFYLCIFKDA